MNDDTTTNDLQVIDELLARVIDPAEYGLADIDLDAVDLDTIDGIWCADDCLDY